MAYFETTKLKDSDGNLVDPASDDAIVLLRRMVKLMESQNATDIANRQRVSVDAFTATVPAVTSIGGIVGALPGGGNLIGFVNQDQRQFIDVARTNYNTGIRSKLTFS